MTANVYVAGHKGMVGSAIVRYLKYNTDFNIITRTREELDLLSQVDVAAFFEKNNIDQVYLAAAKVGGIHANNTYPADFLYQNLMIQSNIIHQAYISGVKKLLFLGSSCIYPRMAEQPMEESALLSGFLEPTNEPYAIAKIAGIKLCESYNRQYAVDYRSVMPTNLYGPNDNFHPENSHVLPALIRRFHEAKEDGLSEVVVWGTGKPMREFLFVDDMASACFHVMSVNEAKYKEATQSMLSHINVGTGIDCTIQDLTECVSKVVGYEGNIVFDVTKLDGAPRKLMNVTRLADLGWSSSVDLHKGIEMTYQWFIENQLHVKGK